MYLGHSDCMADNYLEPRTRRLDGTFAGLFRRVGNTVVHGATTETVL